MKLLTSVLLLAIPVFISSCISCSHHTEYGSSTTTTASTGEKADSIIETPDSIEVKNETLPKDYPKMGKALKTKDFEFTVNKIQVTDNFEIIKGIINMETGPEKGYKYLVVYLTINNANQVNHKIPNDGEVWIYKNGWKYKYKTMSSVTYEEDGSNLDKKSWHNKTAELIYKIPKGMTGAGYYQPAASNDDERISLGVL